MQSDWREEKTACRASSSPDELRIFRRMYGCGIPSREPKRAPSPFALRPRPAEFAPRRPNCPASVCITIVGDGGCSIRSITTVSRVPARQSQVWPQ